jgi:hypothetical protein
MSHSYHRILGATSPGSVMGFGPLGCRCGIQVHHPGEQKQGSINPHKEWGEKEKIFINVYHTSRNRRSACRGAGATRPRHGSGPLSHHLWVQSTCVAPGLPPPAPLDSAITTVFSTTAFGSGIASGATFATIVMASLVTIATTTSFAAAATAASFVTATAAASFALAAMASLAAIATMACLVVATDAATFIAAATLATSSVASAAFLASACVAEGLLPLKPRTCPMVALLGACCPCDTGSVTELLSPQTNLLFFSGGAVCLDDAPASLNGDREPALKADPVDTTFPFPLPEVEVVSALLQPLETSALRIRCPGDMPSMPHCNVNLI